MPSAQSANFEIQWGVKIPLRDGIQLEAIVYLPKNQYAPLPCLFSLSPYTAQRNHAPASYFAAHGFPFLAIDVRGRGNSQGEFRPLIQEAQDGYDIVEWLAQQPYCDGKVAMYSGSYEGYAQWATAKEFPPHLATIVPGMAVAPGIDFPMGSNILYPFVMRWLILTGGRAAQDRLFADESFWRAKSREWLESGRPFRELDQFFGSPSKIFQEWLSHPLLDAYWDNHRPSAEHYRKLSIPILTLTGSYDDDQPGALTYYREHLREASHQGRACHYLVIGPWNHASTLQPKDACGGLRFGPAAVIDMMKLHLDWYAWTLQGGPKPEFLRKNVAYYVMGAEKWRYADSLEEITSHTAALFLQSAGNPCDVFHAGSLLTAPPAQSEPDHYIYDPRDVGHAQLESTLDPESYVDQCMIHSGTRQQLVYHSALFEKDTEISGFFRLVVWLSIDQPDTDFHVAVYEIGIDGGSILLSSDRMRARYRESLREAKLIETSEPQRYEFSRFTFISRLISKGHRLRLVIGPIQSIHYQKNYNSGGVIADESASNAKPVRVMLFHDRDHSSALYAPIGQAEGIVE
jgi:putative CocE/NonD family hydrolase